SSTATRDSTTTPLQALFLMNDPFVHEQARGFAARLLDERDNDEARIERAIRYAFSRSPTTEEREEMLSFLAAIESRLSAANPPASDVHLRAWESLSRVIFMSSEFVYLN